MTTDTMRILGMNEGTMHEEWKTRYGKGLYHCRAVAGHLYSRGSLAGLADSPSFRDNPELARRIISDFGFVLPPVSRSIEEDGTVKFTLTLADGELIEAVIVPMRAHTTLCVSSQAGCARGCSFCRTARMGLARNLSAAEIVAQYLVARFAFGSDIQNVVFMGMGEPFDNLDSVLTAVDILCDPRGVSLLPRRVSLSTCGQCDGLDRLRDRISREGEKGYHLLPLAVSLHAANDALRDALMPVNRQWPLARLRETLLSMPHARDKDKLFFEYIVIPNVNDGPEDAAGLRDFLVGFGAKVNLIAFQAPADSPYASATREDVNRFWEYLRGYGIAVYSRLGKGQGISASCGQLATDDGL